MVRRCGGGKRTGHDGGRPAGYGPRAERAVRDGELGLCERQLAALCQPLTAPAMMPPMICLPKITNTSSSGRVLISAPAMTMLWSGV